MFKYKANRYGSYYTNTYYSYSGGKGYPRYSRVYAGTRNYYTYYYNRMFDWFKTEDFKVYKKTPSSSISVCKNYEADENGTYLGIFTCPLPYEPDSHVYCCGQKNAEYCCKFWHVPQNVGAAVIAMIMGVGIIVCAIFVTVQSITFKCKRHKAKRALRARRRLSLFRTNMKKISIIKGFSRVRKSFQAPSNETMIETIQEEKEDESMSRTDGQEEDSLVDQGETEVFDKMAFFKNNDAFIEQYENDYYTNS